MKRAAIYLRVSTEQQARDGTSLDNQLEVCREYARRHNLQIARECIDDVSGASLDRREGMAEVRELAEQGLIDAVVIYHVDRWARDTTDSLVIYRELRGNGVELLSATVPIEDTPTGKLMFTMLSAFAELERTIIVDRTRRGKERRAKEGKPIGTWMQPYGYRYVPVRERSVPASGNGAGHGMLSRETRESYEIVPEEAEVVRQIFSWCVREKLTLYRIVMRLRDMGIRTKRRGDWSLSTVQRILRNDIYLGNGYWNRTFETGKRRTDKWSRAIRDRSEWIHFPVPQIIEQGLWEAAQRQLDENGRESPRNIKRFYLLRGMVFCVRCGRRYQGMSGDGHRAYRCPYRTRVFYVVDERRCDNTNFNADALERKVWEVVTSYITDPSRFYKEPPQHVAALYEAQLDEATRIREEALRSVDAALRNLEEEETRMIAAYRVGVVSLPHLQSAVQEIRARRAARQEERKSLVGDEQRPEVTPGPSWESLEETRLLALQGIDANTPEGKRALLELMQLRIYVDGRQLRLTGLFLHDLVIEW